MTKAHGEMSGEAGLDVDAGKMSRRKQSRPQHIAKTFEDVNIEEISLDVQLPSDLLQLKVTHDDPLTLGVYSRLALPQTSSFGPFRVTRVEDREDSEEENHKESNRKLKVTEDITVYIESDCGAWLSLLQTTTDKALANARIIVREDGCTWCELCCDLTADTLLVTMLIIDAPDLRNSPSASFSAQAISLDFSPMPALIYQYYNKGNFGELFGKTCQLQGQPPWERYYQPRQGKNTRRRRGSTHSEKNTEDKHSRYSVTTTRPSGKRSKDESEEAPRKLFKSDDGPISLNPTTSPASPSSAPNSPHRGSNSPSSVTSSCGSPNRNLSPPITGAFKCQSCPYTADKKSRLIEHMLSHSEEEEDIADNTNTGGHSVSTVPSPKDREHTDGSPVDCTERAETKAEAVVKEEKVRTTMVNGEKDRGRDHVDMEEDELLDEDQREEEVDGSQTEWNCAECDISFSSLGTFQAHKNFYCSLRGSKRSRRLSDGYRKKEGGVQLQPEYTLLPTMMCPGMIVPTQMMGLPPFMTTYAVPYIMPVAPPPPPPPVAHNMHKLPKKRQQDQPLDLSCKKEEEEEEYDVDDEGGIPSECKADASPETEKYRVTAPKLQAKLLRSQATTGRKYSAVVVAAPPQQPPVIMAAGPSVFRCEDCNIVFYKHENYTVHKEHYCAGRRAGTKLEQQQQPSSPESASTPPHSPAGRRSLPTFPESKSKSSPSSLSKSNMASPASVRDSTTPDEYTVQYFCIPCKIKFSSPDTLEAHQQYYCPARKVIAEQLAAHHQQQAASLSCVTALSPKSSSTSSSTTMGIEQKKAAAIVCSQCHKGFGSMDEMMKHPCNQATMKIPMFCCPYCEYVAQSDSRLLDHIKAHAPTKAYRCTLCGYRGNTVRGMRMHGKTHIDAGDSFTDEHMCELEEPPLIPKRLRTVTESVAINVATEMIKQNGAAGLFQPSRQRSRSVSAMEGSTVRAHAAPHICEECRSVFKDTTALQAHMQLHLQEKKQQPQEEDFRCQTCDFVTGAKGELVRHMKTAHDKFDNGGPSQVVGSPDATDNRKDIFLMKKNSARYTIENLISIKQEKLPAALFLERNNNVSPVKKCISAPAVMETTGGSSPRTMNDNNQQPSSSPRRSSPVGGDGGSSPQAGGSSSNSSHQEATLVGLGPGGERLIGLNTDKCNYCSQCDISFVYRNTYLAHKKYYCSSHIGERTVVVPAAEV